MQKAIVIGLLILSVGGFTWGQTPGISEDFTKFNPNFTGPSVEVDYKSLPQPDKANLTGEWRVLRHAAVNFPNGTRITDIRASIVEVFATDVKWCFSLDGSASTITGPSGHAVTTDSGWQYPGSNKFGVVLWQTNGLRQNVTATSSSSPQRFNVSNTLDIYFAVNDAKNTYDDNSGAYDIYIRVVQP